MGVRRDLGARRDWGWGVGRHGVPPPPSPPPPSSPGVSLHVEFGLPMLSGGDCGVWGGGEGKAAGEGREDDEDAEEGEEPDPWAIPAEGESMTRCQLE